MHVSMAPEEIPEHTQNFPSKSLVPQLFEATYLLGPHLPARLKELQKKDHLHHKVYSV